MILSWHSMTYRMLVARVGWIYFFVAAFVIAVPAAAQNVSAPNGCGTGWNRYVVPDSLPILQCDFKEACNAHDICYARCEARVDGECKYRRCRVGGDLYGQDVCMTDERLIGLAINAALRRDACDAQFYTDLQRLNVGKIVCRAFAVIYRSAVKRWGDDAFIGVDVVPSALTQQSREDYEKAIREFFRNGTDAQFRRIVEEDEAGSKAVDMKRPLGFTRDKGLFNLP